jgi:AcrR family transcriptional regulator
MDGRLAKGAETRRTTLRRAAEIASVEGLDGLTIGRLAAELELSKSGIFAHFGSKEDLQLAVLDFARQVFVEHVLTPALTVERGLPRLTALYNRWIDYSRSRVFPGGCFFASAAAEFDARDGRVHDAVVEGFTRWMDVLTSVITQAVTLGHLHKDTDIPQLAFELDALIRAANSTSVLTGDHSAYDRAIAGIEARLRR